MALRIAVCLCALTPPNMHICNIAWSLKRKSVLPLGSEIAVWQGQKNEALMSGESTMLRWSWSHFDRFLRVAVMTMLSRFKQTDHATMLIWTVIYVSSHLQACSSCFSCHHSCLSLDLVKCQDSRWHSRRGEWEELRWVALGCKTSKKSRLKISEVHGRLFFSQSITALVVTSIGGAELN